MKLGLATRMLSQPLLRESAARASEPRSAEEKQRKPAPQSTVRRKTKTRPKETLRAAAKRKKRSKRAYTELRPIAEAFVDLLLRFFATNGSLFSILQYETKRSNDHRTPDVGPLYDAFVARLDEMRERGDVRRDVDTRHLVLSCVAMIAYPLREEPFVTTIWPEGWEPELIEERKRHVVEMILARALP